MYRILSPSRARRAAACLAIAWAVLLAAPSAALACETYVVGPLTQSGPHAWHAQAVLRVRVSRVDEAGPEWVDRNPLGYQMTVLKTLRAAGVPGTFEVARAAGCDTMRLTLGEQLVVAVGARADLRVPRGSDQGYGSDNYNSAWYAVQPGGTLSLVPGSAWVDGLGRRTTVGALLLAANTLPSTDSAVGAGAAGDLPLTLLAELPLSRTVPLSDLPLTPGTGLPLATVALAGVLALCLIMRRWARRLVRTQGSGRMPSPTLHPAE